MSLKEHTHVLPLNLITGVDSHFNFYSHRFDLMVFIPFKIQSCAHLTSTLRATVKWAYWNFSASWNSELRNTLVYDAYPARFILQHNFIYCI